MGSFQESVLIFALTREEKSVAAVAAKQGRIHLEFSPNVISIVMVSLGLIWIIFKKVFSLLCA